VSARSAGDGAEALRVALRAEGGTLAESVVDRVKRTAEPGPAQIEGSRLHYGLARVVHTDDRDLALLLGDQLYALGLARLATLGDLAAVAELADVISLVAQAHSASDPALAEAVWEAGAVAVGWGSSDQYTAAKALFRAGDTGARDALAAASRRPRS
jgi:hypothetical protein